MRNFARLAAMAAFMCVAGGFAGCTFEGEEGVAGVAGTDGTDGVNGTPGRNGVDGVNGEDGVDGVDGMPGRDGTDGAPGQQGEPGEPGQPGAPGQDGEDGADGRDGADGAPGEQGEPGEPGQAGEPGTPGEPGDSGEPGDQGPEGPEGPEGPQGPAGESAEGEGEGEEPEPECVTGSFECACYPNHTCNDALDCKAGLCVESEEPECPVGNSWCSCYPNGTCNDDLACSEFEHICVPQCTQIGCPCDQDDNECDDGLLCGTMPWAGGTFCDGDFDEDGVADMADNCPRNANESQADLDGDHEGDVCDGDVDGDEVPNRADHCPRFWDRQNACQCQPDTAGDPGDAAEVAACYSGLNATRGVGLCRAGTRRCEFNENTLAITWSACTGEVLPVAEVCGNGLDENCNGAFDDGCAPPPPPPECNAGATRVCGNPAVGQCRQGQQTCDANGRWAACANEVRPVVEICNNLDDDCDSAVDEGLNCAPAPNGGTDQIRECAPADPVGNWGLSIMGVPNAVVEQATAAGQCVQMDTLTVSRSNLRFNARRPNNGLYCCGTVAGNNVPQDLCPGLQVFRDGVQVVHGSGAGQLQCQNDANGNNYRINP